MPSSTETANAAASPASGETIRIRTKKTMKGVKARRIFMSVHRTNDVDGVSKHVVAPAATKGPAAKILPGAIPFETARRHLHFGSARVRLIAVVFAVRSPGASYDAKTACRPACTSSNAIT